VSTSWTSLSTDCADLRRLETGPRVSICENLGNLWICLQFFWLLRFSVFVLRAVAVLTLSSVRGIRVDNGSYSYSGFHLAAPRQGCQPLAGGRAKRHPRLSDGKQDCTPEGCQHGPRSREDCRGIQPQGVPARRTAPPRNAAATPLGSNRNSRHAIRGCRFARPPANCCDPYRGRTATASPKHPGNNTGRPLVADGWQHLRVPRLRVGLV
jgi:hypothetical protein